MQRENAFAGAHKMMGALGLQLPDYVGEHAGYK